MKEQLKLYQGYIIIILLSLISVIFLPMIGTAVDLGFAFPNTAAGWLIWIASKLAVTTINILLFDQFVRQAKINIKDNENYLKAQAIFNELETPEEEFLPTPREYLGKLYRTKGVTLFFTTLLSLVAFSNALLTFNWVSMLTYLFTIVMGCIFGWITMANVEDYWTDTYYKLALKILRQSESEKTDEKQAELTPAAYVENINSLLEEKENGIKT